LDLVHKTPLLEFRIVAITNAFHISVIIISIRWLCKDRS
jgi:hypothetical protein